MFNVPGSIAVVTGASSGIGHRLALELAATGATVVALARREERLAALTPQLRQSSPESHHITCDVRDTTRFVATLRDVEQ